ncbi:MAG: tRNA dihydrouridine synthase DusB [Clostridia bacterium]|nr:tRNA dihydrouridine synthase DusB [Clostridia bacterium]
MLKIGNIEIKNGLALAPMAGITDVSFRKLCIRYGASLTVSEMISAKGVYYKDKKTAALAASSDGESPFALQLFGSDPEIMGIAAEQLLTINPAIDIFDINMGCPMPKITGNGDGCSLMRNPELAGRVVKAVVNATNAPVTVKMRTGWDKTSINAPLIAQICEANGASAICVHGRTREQLYKPPIDVETIRKVKKSVRIPVFANGGVYTGEDAVKLLRETECDGIAIGQGAMGNPFLFKECVAAIENKGYIAPTTDEILKIATEHVCLLCEDKGEYIGVREARKHLGWYIKGMSGAAEARRAINASETKEELFSVLDSLRQR